MKRKTILLISSDCEMVDECTAILKNQGCFFQSVKHYDSALDALDEDFRGIVIVDATVTGDEYPGLIKYVSQSIAPVFIIGRENTTDEMVEFLNAGADEYIEQPLNPDVLLAKIHALSRRVESRTRNQDTPFFAAGDIRIDYERGQVTVKGEVVVMTRREYEILCELIHHAGRILSYRHLLRTFWGPGYADEKQYLHLYIHNLREKIETDPRKPGYIMTIPKVGYIFKQEKKE
jgi:two-component system KDP operon response regulator KdpE